MTNKINEHKNRKQIAALIIRGRADGTSFNDISKQISHRYKLEVTGVTVTTYYKTDLYGEIWKECGGNGNGETIEPMEGVEGILKPFKTSKGIDSIKQVITSLMIVNIKNHVNTGELLNNQYSTYLKSIDNVKESLPPE
jgi:hypothetical protein